MHTQLQEVTAAGGRQACESVSRQTGEQLLPASERLLCSKHCLSTSQVISVSFYDGPLR